MKIRLFVTSSAALLLAWLGLTFVREVPGENYPQLGKGSRPLSAQAEPEMPQVTPVEEPSLVVMQEESSEPAVVAD